MLLGVTSRLRVGLCVAWYVLPALQWQAPLPQSAGSERVGVVLATPPQWTIHTPCYGHGGNRVARGKMDDEKVISLSDERERRNGPDAAHVCFVDGEKWFEFCAEFEDEGRRYGFNFCGGMPDWYTEF